MEADEREQFARRIVEAYSDMLIRVGYTWLGNPYDAQDICQNVLIKRMARTEEFQSREQEKAWLLRVAVNECKSLKRSAWFRRTVGLEEGAVAAVSMPEIEGEDLFERVQSLPANFRQVIYLYYYEGYSVTEIADILGQSPNLVSKHLARARAKLKNELGGQINGQSLS